MTHTLTKIERRGRKRKVTPSIAENIEEMKKNGMGSVRITRSLHDAGTTLSRTTVTRVLKDTNFYKKGEDQ